METLEILLFTICVIAIAILCTFIANAFDRIKILKIEISSLKLKANSLDKELWKLNHPSKYNIGDKVKCSQFDTGLIREKYVNWGNDMGDCTEWRYKIDLGVFKPIYDKPEWAIYLVKQTENTL